MARKRLNKSSEVKDLREIQAFFDYSKFPHIPRRELASLKAQAMMEGSSLITRVFECGDEGIHILGPKGGKKKKPTKRSRFSRKWTYEKEKISFVDTDAVNPDSLERFSASDWHLLPYWQGIYFFFQAEQLVYIGAAGCVVSRVKSHEILSVVSRLPGMDFSQWKVSCLQVPTSQDLSVVECALIRRFKPCMNRRGNT